MSDGPRRGSSMFSNPSAAGGEPRTGAGVDSGSGAPTPNNPVPVAPGGGVGRRGSAVLQPGALGGGIGFGIDFDDSDYDDSDDDEGLGATGRSGRGMGQGGGSMVPPGAGTGGPNHRPYVGGFAAAAYEAARAHHTQNQIKQQHHQQSHQASSSSKPNKNTSPRK